MKKIKPFLISFLLSTIILSIMFVITYSMAKSRLNTQASYMQENEEILNTYMPKSDDNLSILVIGCKQRNLPADFFVLLRFDTFDNMIYIIPLPNNCTSTVNIKTQTLSEHYDYGGVKYAKKAAENLFFTKIDEYIRLDYQTSAELVDYFSYIKYTLSYPVSTDEYNFPEGEQLLDGKRYASLLFYADETLYPYLISDFFELVFNKETSDRLDGIFDIIYNGSDSSISQLDIQTRIKAIKAFAQKDLTKAKVITLGGKEDFNKFIISDASYDEVKGLLEQRCN